MRCTWTVLAAGFLGACAIVDPQLAAKSPDAGGDEQIDAASSPSTGSGGRTAGASGTSAGRDGGMAGRDGAPSGQGGAAGSMTDAAPPLAGSDAAGSNADGGSGNGGAGTAGSTAGTEAGRGGAGAGAGAGAAGATAGTGGTAGSAGTVPPEPVGESRCYDTFENQPVCEGFEQPLKEPWWEAGLDGTVRLQSARTYVGDGALAARAMMGQARFVGRTQWPNGLKSGSIHLRAYVYVPASAVIDTVVVLGMSEIDAPFGGVTVAVKDVGLALDVHPEGAGKNVVLVSPPTPFHLPRDRWNCMQLAIGVSATQGSVQLKVNGVVAVESPVPLSTLPVMGFKGMSAGLIYTDPSQPSVEVFIDELVAGTAPIPCDPAIPSDPVTR
jgi:hypothetical protein